MVDVTDKKTKLNVVGLCGLIVFYLIIFFTGLFAQKLMNKLNGKKSKEQKKEQDTELSNTDDMMLAGRDINYLVGIFTMTATWVGGGYINGAAEVTISHGILWCQAPFCYAFSLAAGGLFFAKKMRNMKYVTMLDPLQNKYGRHLGALFYIPAFSGEILWSASILAALGTSLRVICGLSDEISIIASAGIAMTYTLFGGLYSVAFTDVIQLICIFVGLILSIPFMTKNDAVTSPLQSTVSFNGTPKTILGSIAPEDAATWVDYMIMMMCGGIPWQAYFQRVLSSRNAKVARTLSISAGLGCFCAAIPAVVIGIITLNTDWVKTGYGSALSVEEYKLAVPLCLNYLCHPVISFIGLGAVSAAVMSSTDSSILGVSSMFTRNVFVKVFKPNSSDKMTLWVLRFTVLANTAIAMAIAIAVKSVYGLYLICSDLVFVLLFPHLLLVVHYPHVVNRYGMLCGFSIALLLRGLSGEPVLGYDAIIKFPYYAEAGPGESAGNQRFPFRTLCMIVHLLLVIGFSAFSEMLHKMGYFKSCDFLGEWTKDKENEKDQGTVIENVYPISQSKVSDTKL